MYTNTRFHSCTFSHLYMYTVTFLHKEREKMKLNNKLNSKKPRIISVGNEKGGVGKSSLVRIIPYVLSMDGYKVLIVDFDPQGNTTKSLFVTKELQNENEPIVFNKTLMKGIVDGDLSDIIVNAIDNIDFIPSSADLESFPVVLSKMFGLVDVTDDDYWEVKNKQYSYFKSLVDNIKDDYDFIFFDTPPTKSDFVRATTYASDYVLVAFQTQSDSLDGALNYIEQTLQPMIDNTDAIFQVVGVLPNQMTKGAIDTEVVLDAFNFFGENNVFSNYLPFNRAIQHLPRKGIANDQYWTKRMYRESVTPIVDEMIERINLIEKEDE